MAGFTINRVVVSGNLTRDPEARSTPGGTELCKFRIAVNERFKDRDGQWQDRPNYFGVTIFGGIGGWVAKNIHKGDGIVIEGRLQWHEWQAQDGSKRSDVEIVADSVVPMPRDGQPRSNGGNGGQQRQAAPVATSGDPGEFAYDAPLPGSDDDIPFLWTPLEWDDRYHSNR